MFSSSNYLKNARFSKTCVLFDFLWKLVSGKELVIETLKIYIGHANCRFCLILTKTEFDRHNGKKKLLEKNFTKIRPVGAEIFREDRRTDVTTLRVVLRYCIANGA
jgi:hypothetical protein